MFRLKRNQSCKARLNYNDKLSADIDAVMAKIQEDRKEYDRQTGEILRSVSNSDHEPKEYLREILWELIYARRKAERP